MSEGNLSRKSELVGAVGQPHKLFAELDERDLEIAAERMGAFLDNREPKVGDYVKFADGVERRISYVWALDDPSVQTSDAGSFYLGNGYCSFSGSLYSGVPASTLKLTGTTRRGQCWFFHHDYHAAHNSVTIKPPIFDEWTCSLESTS